MFEVIIIKSYIQKIFFCELLLVCDNCYAVMRVSKISRFTVLPYAVKILKHIYNALYYLRRRKTFTPK